MRGADGVQCAWSDSDAVKNDYFMDTVAPRIQMLENIINSNIAIIGGGRFCKLFLQYLFDENFIDRSPNILGVADINSQAEGLVYARQMGIYTTNDFKDLYHIEDLQVLIELTDDASLWDVINQTKPSGVALIDHLQARAMWSSLQLESEKRKALKALREKENVTADVLKHAAQFADRLIEVNKKRNLRYLEIEKDFIESERSLAQIIQGSTMPTFVINENHVVTHWNKALERLSGASTTEIVGTKKQGVPFWGKERQTMADVILDQVGENEIKKLYGRKWRKSALIEGAYEAEMFFPNLGQDGKWCWFTAAPIKLSSEKIIGAIETIWDKTEDKLAEQEKERHTRLLTETAKELAESEQAMTQIIQGSTMPTFVIDENHRVTHWNKALERLTGCSAEEIIGTNKQWRPFYKKARPTLADVILDQIEEDEIKKLYGRKWRKSVLIEGAYEAEGFFRNIVDDGRWFWFTAAPIKSPVGKIVGAIETLWDKTEDKKAEQDREQHTRELSTLVAIYTALTAPTDFDLGINQAIEELYRFLSADSICIYLLENDGNYHLRYGSGHTKDACKKISSFDEASIIFQVAQNNAFTIYENLPETETEEIRSLQAHKFASLAYIPISTRKNKTFGVIRIGSRKPKQFSYDQQHVLELIGNRIGVALDNAMLQEQYIRSEEKYRTLFDSDPHPTFILDSRTFQIRDTNQRAQDSYGFTREELLGRPFLDLGDENDQELAEGLKHLAQDQSMLFTKKRHYRKGGHPFYVNINISYANYGDSNVVIASITDITESVEKETQLIQASKLTTLGQMAAGIAHEINQPLNVIQVCADFFNKMMDRGHTIDTEDLKSMANDISRNVQRAAGIIQHMRDFARQSDVIKNKVNINDPIRDVFKVLGHQLKVHQVELQLDLDPEIPAIMADHNRLEQVFVNLVTNALDAMDQKCSQPENQGARKLLKIKSFAANGQVAVVVSDTGVGMTEEVMRKIYEPFFTTKDVGKGTGLGFSISYGIIKDYDGTIDIRSKVGEGTTFELRFPVWREDSTKDEQDTPHR